MISKRIKIMGLVSIMMVAGVANSALANNIFDKPVREYISLGEAEGFDSLLSKVKREMPKDEEVKLRAAYEKALAMEEKGDVEEATELWGVFREGYSEYTKDEWYEGLKEQPDFSDFRNFDAFLKGMEFEGTADAKDTLMKLYSEGLKLENGKRGEELQDVWTEVYRALAGISYEVVEKETDGNGYYTFDGYISEFKDSFTDEEIGKLKSIYEEAVKSSLSEDEEKATKLWEQFYKIFDDGVK